MVVATLGVPLFIHCHAIGWPRPSVTWWRGERMLPLSSERYEQFRDYSLLIKVVTFRDLGPYTCQAYNGYGRPSSYVTVVQAVGPVYSVDADDSEFSRYLVPAPVAPPTTPPPPTVRPPLTPKRPSYWPAYVDPYLPPQRPSTSTPTSSVTLTPRPVMGIFFSFFFFIGVSYYSLSIFLSISYFRL